MRKIAVGDVMTRNFISEKPAASLYECSKQIVKNRVNTLLIVEGNKLLGILTARDILWAITKKPDLNLNEIKVLDIVKKRVEVIKPSADIAQAIKKMRVSNFRTLPVMSKGRLIGMVTLKDILRIEPDLYSEIGELVQIKEEERKLKGINVEWPHEGLCDNCSTFADLLKVYDRLLCPECREELY